MYFFEPFIFWSYVFVVFNCFSRFASYTSRLKFRSIARFWRMRVSAVYAAILSWLSDLFSSSILYYNSSESINISDGSYFICCKSMSLTRTNALITLKLLICSNRWCQILIFLFLLNRWVGWPYLFIAII